MFFRIFFRLFDYCTFNDRVMWATFWKSTSRPRLYRRDPSKFQCLNQEKTGTVWSVRLIVFVGNISIRYLPFSHQYMYGGVPTMYNFYSSTSSCCFSCIPLLIRITCCSCSKGIKMSQFYKVNTYSVHRDKVILRNSNWPWRWLTTTFANTKRQLNVSPFLYIL